jgi:tRNA 2-selenouridine synthase
MRVLEPADFVRESFETPVVDVRSPAEYAKGHLPGALNLPLFGNDERAVVGTIYKQRGKEAAIEKGLEIVGPRLAELSRMAGSSAIRGRLLVYCWRGGMRSEKMAWLFELTGLRCDVMRGGYKGYREYLRNSLAGLKNLIILEGKTGSGKTEILHALREKGEQILDLEALARHKGSVFGALGQERQPTTQQFQNDLFDAWLKLDPGRPVWVEGESLNIGSVTLPESFWASMNESRVLLVEAKREWRKERILRDYAGFPVADLIALTDKITQRLGHENRDKAVGFLREGNIGGAVEILLDYYDKGYSFSLKKYKKREPAVLTLKSKEPKKQAEEILARTDLWNE